MICDCGHEDVEHNLGELLMGIATYEDCMICDCKLFEAKRLRKD